MKKMNKLLAAATLGLAAVGTAQAQTASTTFQVTANVTSACQVAATDLAFGAYSATAGNVDNSSTITVTCSNLLPYSVNVGANPTTRSMARAGGGGSLGYGLYSDAARTTGFTATGTGSGVAQNIPVYGRIGGAQFAPVGNYADTVTVTVNY